MWEWVARSNTQQISYVPVGISLRTFFLLLVQTQFGVVWIQYKWSKLSGRDCFLAFFTQPSPDFISQSWDLHSFEINLGVALEMKLFFYL